MNIKRRIIDSQLTSELFGKLDLMPYTHIVNRLGSEIIVNEDDNGKILAVAFLIDVIEEQLEDYKEKLCKDDYAALCEIHPKMIQKGTHIGVLESVIKGKNYGSHILEFLKENYYSLYLMSNGGTEDYWSSHGFTAIGNDVFAWSKMPIYGINQFKEAVI